MGGLNDGTPLYVAAYPAAWRIETINDDVLHRGFEYIRSELTLLDMRNGSLTRCTSFYWGLMDKTWDLAEGPDKGGNGRGVGYHPSIPMD